MSRGVLGRVELLHSGKVRDVYADGDDLILVASDRISIYDVALPTPIPDKGRLLTALSLWWFEQLADLVPNHVISATDVPAEFAGRAIRCQRLDMVPVECVARGYLTGGGLREYEQTGAVSGVPLPRGLGEASILPEPIFTPSSKAPMGEHDEPITYDDVVDKVGQATAERLRQITIDVYRRGAELAADRGILVADTKIELGWAPDGTLVLADELLTSDSSRFWPAESYQPGRVQFSYDKQYVRDWATGSGWNKQAPAPGHAGRGGRGDPGPLHRRLREAHRQPLGVTAGGVTPPSRGCAARPCATGAAPRSRSSGAMAGSHCASERHCARRVARSGQKPTARPAAYAAPRQVVSVIRERTTGTSSTSARNCMSRPLAVIPPSTRRRRSATSESAFIASTTSRVCHADASSTARARCPLVM